MPSITNHVRDLFLDENNIVPVYLENEFGVPKTGVINTAATVKYIRESDGALVTFAPSVSEWDEKGEGWYALTFPAVLIDEEGCFDYQVMVSGFPYADIYYRATSSIAPRPDRYEVFCTAAYDRANSQLLVLVWLHKNGQLVTTPTSCQFTVKENGGTIVINESNSSPNADGVFSILVDPVNLNAHKPFERKLEVVYNGVTYTSADGMTSFN